MQWVWFHKAADPGVALTSSRYYPRLEYQKAFVYDLRTCRPLR